MISEVVGNSEAVIRTDDLELFSRLMKFVSVTSSMLCSTSRTSAESVTGADLVEMAKQSEDASDVSIDDIDFSYIPEPPVTSDNSDDGWDDDEWD